MFGHYFVECLVNNGLAKSGNGVADTLRKRNVFQPGRAETCFGCFFFFCFARGLTERQQYFLRIITRRKRYMFTNEINSLSKAIILSELGQHQNFSRRL